MKEEEKVQKQRKRMLVALNNGIAGAGKDSVADYLCEHHGFIRMSLSEGIYDIIHKLGYSKNEKPPREVLRIVGESKRCGNITYWLNELESKLNTPKYADKNIVVTDVRKGLEHFYLKELGFDNVLVTCDDDVAFERLSNRDGKKDTDKLKTLNEQEASRCIKHEHIIVNNGSIAQLHSIVDLTIDKLKGGVLNEKASV